MHFPYEGRGWLQIRKSENDHSVAPFGMIRRLYQHVVPPSLWLPIYGGGGLSTGIVETPFLMVNDREQEDVKAALGVSFSLLSHQTSQNHFVIFFR